MDESDDDLFGQEPWEPPDQDGPDLFGLEPDDQTQDYPETGADSSPGLEIEELPVQPAASGRSADEVTASLMRDVDARRDTRQPISRPETPLALYRRYRPDTFADVIGQEHVTEPLQRALLNNRVNHAYLFSGPRGCGKTTSARILARALNCERGPAPVPCGECQSCLDLARGGLGSIDVIEIDAASHGGVNEARDLRERAFFSPVHSRYKIYIIDEAHMVTKEGFNALLKVVEEPPPHVKFIFATTEPEKVLGTIRSRTHHYPFRLVPPKVLGAYLGQVCDAEGVDVEPAVLPLVVRSGAGSVRDSLSVLDQLLGAASEAGVTYRQATALLGYTPDALLDEIVDAFAAGDSHGVFAAVDKVIEVGQDPRRFAEDLLRRLRDLIIVAAVPDALSSGLVDVAADQADRLVSQASALGAGELTRAAEVIAVGLTEMRGTTAPRLHLELMCARVLLPGADTDGRGLHARLDRLERRLGMPGADAPPPPVTAPEETADHPAQPLAARAPAPSVATPPPSPVPERSNSAAPARGAAGAPEPSITSRNGRPRTLPAAEPDREAAAPTPPPTSESGAPPTPATPSTSFGTADLRRLWPDVLQEVKTRRRFTWILLSQNAQVVEVREGVLTLGMANQGARDSFGRGGSADVLREAILQVVGVSLHIQPILDVAAGQTPSDSPGPEPEPEPAGEPPEPLTRSAAAQAARENLRATRSGTGETPPDEPEAEPSRADVSLDDDTSSDDLLKKHLGAELIAEED